MATMMDSASGHHHNNHPMHNHVWGDLEVEEKVIEQLLDSSVTQVSGSEQQPPDSPLPEDGVRRVRFNANSKIASYPSEKSLSEEEEEEEYVDSSDDDYEEEGEEEGEEGEENSSGEEEEGTFSDDEVVITDHDSGELPFIQQGNGQQTLVGQSSAQHTPTDTPTPTPTPITTSKSSSGSPTLAQSIETLSSISSAQQAGTTEQQDQPQQQQSPPQRRWFQQRQAIQRYTPRYKSAPQQQEQQQQQQQQKEGEDSSVDGNSNNSNSNGANATPSSHTPQLQQQPGQSQHPQQAQEKPLVVQQLERAKLELNQEIARAKEASENLTISSAKLQESLSHLSDRIAISRSLLAALG